MKELEDIIQDYLQAKDTDYALMINGDWGCGKTYYLNHGFKEFVEKTTCPFPSAVKTKFIHRYKRGQIDSKFKIAFISLYGISSPEDFLYRVFLGVNSWAKNKIFAFIGTAGSKIANVFNVGISKEDVANINHISNNTVLVFDDLERICSDKIRVKEVLGLINEYSEHNHHKVIVVCNEDVYAGHIEGVNKDEEYWQYKEKTIRHTYRFEADVPNVYDVIANSFEKEDFKQFLQQQKTFILHLFSLGGKKNLRTLKFYIDSMFKLFCNTPEVKYKESILRTLSVSTMIYVSEYKNGRRKEMLNELKAKYELDLGKTIWGHQNSCEEKTEPSYSDEVAEIYGSIFHNEMVCLPFIIDYIVTGYLDINLFNNWVNERNKELIRAEDKPEYKLYRKLSSFASIDDNTLVGDLNQIIQYAKDGKFGIIDLMHVYALLVKYHSFDIEGFSITPQIETVFIEAIDRYENDWEHNSNLEYKIPIWDSREKGQECYEKYDVIKQHLLHMNIQSGLADNQAVRNEFLQKAENGDVEGIRHYRENYDNRISLEGIDWMKICNVLETGTNAIACEVASCIQFLIPDSSFIRTEELAPLKKWLDDYAQKVDKRIRKLYILELKSHIDAILNH